jgi:proteasome assembly chaperone 2
MITFRKKSNFTGFTLLIPSVCVGNVAQLATDLLIETLQMEKVGCFWSVSIIPMIGPPAFDGDKDKITTASEFYVSPEKKLIILQIRSPIVASLMAQFLAEVTKFAKDESIEKIIVLTAAFAHEKHHVSGNSFEYTSTETFLQKHPEVKTLPWVKSESQVIHGGGYAAKLLKTCNEQDIAALILYKYISEGDNRPDAADLVEQVNLFLQILPFEDGKIKLSVPVSWNMLFGNAPPNEIY